jgi:hypothetical protein
VAKSSPQHRTKATKPKTTRKSAAKRKSQPRRA